MWHIIIERRADVFLQRLPMADKERVLCAISKLPLAGDIKPMNGHKGYYRLRVGRYRVIYTKDDDTLTVCVVDAGNRGQIYNRY